MSEELFMTTWKDEFMTIDASYAKMRDSGLYRGTRWQYRWALPQYLALNAKIEIATKLF